MYILLSSLLLLGSLTTATPNGNCKVAFRLDDIQEDWLVESQQALINIFIRENVPLTVGIISELFGKVIAPTPRMRNFLNNALGAPGANALIECASHTMDHTSLKSQTYDQQKTVCSTSKLHIEADLPNLTAPVTTMICPYDEFNQNTLNALRATGYTAISAMMDPDTCNNCDGHNFYQNCADTGFINSLYHTPSKAQTSTNGNDIRIPTQQIIDDIEASITACGFSVVEMHFTEFTNTKTNKPEGVEDMVTIFNAVKSWNCEFKLLRDLFNSTPSSDPVPQPSPSQIPIGPSPSPTETPSPCQTPSPTPAGQNPSQTPEPSPTPSPTPSPKPSGPLPVPVPPTPKPASPKPLPKPTPTPPPQSPGKTPTNPTAVHDPPIIINNSNRDSSSMVTHPVVLVVFGALLLQWAFV